MSLTRKALYISVGLTTANFAWVFTEADRQIWILGAAAAGLCIAIAPRSGQQWLSTAGFLGFVWLAIAGLWRSLPGGWMLTGITLMLIAWSLSQLEGRLRNFGQEQIEGRLYISYLLRVLGTAVVGLLLGLVALNIELSLRFSSAVLLVIIAMAGLALALRLLLWEAR